MPIAIVTGSAGLVGSSTSALLADKGYTVVGIDNNMRQHFFGPNASTAETAAELCSQIDQYSHNSCDIRNYDELKIIFDKYNKNIEIIVHAAAQPSHDWAAKEPFTDFSVNASGTLNLLELSRLHCPDTSFVYVSTNKVYGDSPNYLPLEELESRWEVSKNHEFYKNGINETLSIDQTLHSLFGASKLSADIMVQEYGKYFGMKTVCFRAGCITGSKHEGAELHGFLAYLVKCAHNQLHYSVFGHQGKQVRDNIHANDLANAFWHYHQNPTSGEVYNIGGGRHSNCSVIEAINILNAEFSLKLDWTYVDENRIGDHIWWISDTTKFNNHYPDWELQYSIVDIIGEILEKFDQKFSR